MSEMVSLAISLGEIVVVGGGGDEFTIRGHKNIALNQAVISLCPTAGDMRFSTQDVEPIPSLAGILASDLKADLGDVGRKCLEQICVSESNLSGVLKGLEPFVVIKSVQTVRGCSNGGNVNCII